MLGDKLDSLPSPSAETRPQLPSKASARRESAPSAPFIDQETKDLNGLRIEFDHDADLESINEALGGQQLPSDSRGRSSQQGRASATQAANSYDEQKIDDGRFISDINVKEVRQFFVSSARKIPDFSVPLSTPLQQDTRPSMANLFDSTLASLKQTNDELLRRIRTERATARVMSDDLHELESILGRLEGFVKKGPK